MHVIERITPHNVQMITSETMNWDDLRLFLAVARAGSVSGAGKALGVHHTGVARRMARFEDALGSRLFHRSKGGYALTDAGTRLLQQAEGMEAHAQGIARSLAGLDESLVGTVKFTANQDFFDVLIAPRLHELHQRHPGICLELQTTSRVLNLDALEADIALRLTARPDERLLGRRIAPLVMGLYCSPSYLPRPGEPVKVVLFRRQTGLPAWVEHFSGGVVTARVDNLRTAQAAIRAGLGVANLPCFWADADPELRRIDLPFAYEPFDIWLLSHVDLRSTARVRVCREWLVQILRDQQDLLMGRGSRWLDGQGAG